MAVVDKDSDPVVEQLAGHRAKSEQTGQPMYRNEGEQGDGASRIGLRIGDGGASDDRADCHRGGEIDNGPLGKGAPLSQPQTDNCGRVHENRLAGDRAKIIHMINDPGHVGFSLPRAAPGLRVPHRPHVLHSAVE